MPLPTSVSATELLLNVPDPAVALATILPELSAMPEASVHRRNTLDLSMAAETIFGSLPQLIRIRPALVAHFEKEVVGVRIDRLPLLASAAKRVEVELGLVAALRDLSPLSRDVVAMHGLLFTDAQAMANRGIIDPTRLESCKPLQGYRTQYHNLLALEALLRDALPRAAGQTLLTEVDLDRAQKLGQQMMAAIGLRDRATSLPAAEVRMRCLSLLVDTYEEVRRDVTHLRWHERDADDIAPSLWSSQRGRRNDGPVDDETPSADPTDPVDALDEPTAVATGATPGVTPGAPTRSPNSAFEEE
jgi:hypothetical protein